MTDEEKLYVLMAQAEDLQKHAVELQKEAQETFSALPLAVEQAVQKIRSERFSAAVYVFCFGALIAGGIYAGLNVYGSKLQEEHEKLKTAIQDEEATLTKLESKTWGLSLYEDEKGRFIFSGGKKALAQKEQKKAKEEKRQRLTNQRFIRAVECAKAKGGDCRTMDNVRIVCKLCREKGICESLSSTRPHVVKQGSLLS